MKKTILAISFLFLTTMAFFGVPSYAQTAQDKANEINAAGKSAVQSQSATESRGINNAAWEGAGQGGETSSTSGIHTIDLIGGNSPSTQEDEKSSLEEPKTEDATPWKGLLIGLISSLMGAFALLAAAALLAHHTDSFDNHPKGYEISRHYLKIATAMQSFVITTII